MGDQKIKQRIITPSPVELDAAAVAHRQSPRAPALRQQGYDQKFDSHTVFYDIFNSDRGIELVGPPLLNLKDHLLNGTFAVDSKAVTEVHLSDLDRTQDSFIPAKSTATELQIRNKIINTNIFVGEDYAPLFKDKYCLITLSKNNSLQWIRDWASFHATVHGVNAVLLYDNGSDEYTLEELSNALGNVPGLLQTVVVSWPYKYGPQGGTWESATPAPWDSDFCQHGALNHARRRFLRDALGVINADIDELVVLEDGGSIFDKLAEASSPVISYTGRWVEPIRDSESSSPRFTDFVYNDIRNTPCTAKWTASPVRMREAVQWKTHRIVGAEADTSSNVAHRHFKGINNDWKFTRTSPVQFDSRYHVVDRQLVVALDRAFGTSLTEKMEPDHPASTPSSLSLNALKDELLDEHLGLNFVNRIWFWKPNCLVLECSYLGLRFGIDIVETPEAFEMKLIGRDNSSKAIINVALAKDHQRLSANGHWRIATWPKSTDPLRIARDIARFINKG